MGYVTWPRWLPCPYMVKTFKKLLPLNQKANDLETWYVALVTLVLPNWFKWWPWVDHDLLYSKVKFGPFCFWMAKCLSCTFPRNYWSLWGDSQINECMTIYDNPRSRSFTDFIQGHSDSTFSNFFSSKNTRPSEVKFHMDVGMKICSNVLSHMTKMASRPIYVKNLQKSPALEPRGWWPWESWYTASGTPVLPNLFKWWHWVDLDHFYDMVKFVS